METPRNALNIYPQNCTIHIYNECPIEQDDTQEQVCTMCGKVMGEFDLQEHFGFDYTVGYGSKYDGELLHARLCCECFDALLDHMIPLCKTSPIVGS